MVVQNDFFKDRLRKGAQEFRRKKIGQMLEKDSSSEQEMQIIKLWGEYYGREIF